MVRALRPGPPPAPVPARVLRVEPVDGATGVLRDAAVLLKLSAPVDESSLALGAVTVRDDQGAVPGHLLVSGEGDLLVWQPQRRLSPEALHFVLARGLRDAHGRELPEHCSRFVAGPLALADLAQGD